MSAIPHPVAPPRREPTSDEGRQILVVDDSRVQRRLLAASLKRWGYRVIEAECAEEALRILAKAGVDIILSDWMMPGKDGLEFCREFRALDFQKYVYFILLTSKSEREEVANGLDAGADDFLTKPVNSDELRARIAAGERILSMARELTEKNDLLSSALGELRTVYNSLDRDLREARKLQDTLLPRRVRTYDRAEIASFFRPSGHVGGDLVGHFRVSDTQLGIYALDVSGHGVASALMTARLAGYLSGSSPDQNVGLTIDETGLFRMRAPSEVCSILNARLIEEMETDLYFTMVLAQLDLCSGRVRFTQAGHPRPAIQRADGSVEFVGQGGLPIGLLPQAAWEDREAWLDPGDRLLLYSDGLTETADCAGRMLEEAGLADLLRRHGRLRGTEFIDALMGSLEEISGGRFDDDVSGVLVVYSGPG